MNRLRKIIRVCGRWFFATAMIGFGLLQLGSGEFVRLVPALPAWIPATPLWALASGAVLFAGGMMIAIGRFVRVAAAGFAGFFCLVFLCYLPGVWANPGAGYVWTNPCKTLALLATVILLRGLSVETERRPSSGPMAVVARSMRLWMIWFGGFLVVCGVQHFVYVEFVTQMVPAWLPQRQLWAYFTGLALIAGGVGVNFRTTACLAADLAGLMIFLWVVLLHIPRACAAWPNAGETAGIFEALALSGGAFLFASVCREVCFQSRTAVR